MDANLSRGGSGIVEVIWNRCGSEFEILFHMISSKSLGEYSPKGHKITSPDSRW